MSVSVAYATKDNGDRDQPARGEDLELDRTQVMYISYKLPKTKCESGR